MLLSMSNARTRQLTRHFFFLLACLMLLCTRTALALDPSLDISQYAHTAWKVRDGFTRGGIFAIAQTPDGYLWLGTESGLYRFDGVRAVPWQPPAGHELPSNFINNLLVARDGTLWIGTHKGLASFKDGKLSQYPELTGPDILALIEDREGTVWVGAFGTSGGDNLCAARDGSIHCFGTDTLGRGVTALYEDHKGDLWVAAETGLWRWKSGTPQHYSYPFPRGVVGVDSLIEDDSGSILLGTDKGFERLAGRNIESYSLPDVKVQFRPTRMLHSSDGSLWVGTWQGLVHVHQGKTDVFRAAGGLSADFVTLIFEDREGSVWVGTQDGLDRFRDLAAPTISLNQGLANIAAWSVEATPDGSIWIGTADGLNRWTTGHITVYRSRKSLGQDHQGDRGTSGRSSEIANSGLSGIPQALGHDQRGRLWASTSEGVFYFENDRFIRVPGVPGGFTEIILADGQGNVWLSNGAGLYRLTPELTVQRILWSQFGHEYAPALLPDRLQGGLWLGFVDGGIAYFKNGNVHASYSTADGLGKGLVSGLRFGSRGTLWASTEGGLSRIKDGHIATLTSKNGLPCDAVHWSVEDDDHSVWLNMPCGLVRIARSELDAWAADPKHTVQTTIFDASDGVRTPGIRGGYMPAVAKSPDGKIWFLPRDGVSVIDPRHLPSNKVPPPVRIEQITADGKSYWQNWSGDASSSPPKLPPRVRDLTIDYTALSLVVPEKVRFRVKLEGQDKDWRELTDRRVSFTNLAPKHYRFRVIACNNSGVWNEEGAALEFVIPPAWYQTYWFLAACVAAFLALLWAFYRYRLHQLAQQFNMRLEERVGERTRIARDLHDTLLQSFHGILLFLQSGIHLLDEHPAEAKKTLKTAAEQAERAIIEGREAVQGLRASTVERNDLAMAIKTLGGELAAADSNAQRPEFDVQVEGIPRELHPILRDEVYRIAGEAMRNAFRHADAKQIEVEIHYDERRLRVRVRDDGKGIDPKLLSDDGREGHFGLRGMRERAKLIGGKLTVWSELDSGTEVELSIPASHAYTAPDGQRSWLAEKFAKLSGKDRELKS